MGSLSRKTRLEVADRDKWICGICETDIPEDMTDQYHPLYLNIDHIVPQSLGGSDDLDNLRAAHRFCNGSRGNSAVWKKTTDAALYLKFAVAYPEICRYEVGKREKIKNTYFARPDGFSELMEFVDQEWPSGKTEPALVVRYDYKNRRVLRQYRPLEVFGPSVREITL